MNGNAITFDLNAAFEQVLLVRIYPDEIHEDSHEPQLTPSEIRWVREFRSQLLAARDNKPIEDAWAELIGRSGPTRAAWLGQVAISASNPGKRTDVFTRPAIAKLMPDRWIAYATLSDGTILPAAVSDPVRTSLETGPSPSGIDWMVDFAAGLKAGMALIVRPIPAETTSIQRLLVVGARGSLDPKQTQAEIQLLLDAHHYTRGLGILAPGTPTNSSPRARAGFSTRPALPDVIAIEERRYRVGGARQPLCQNGDRSDGTALASALGIDTSTFAYVERADSTDQFDASLLRSILIGATQRVLTRLLDRIVDPGTLADALTFARERVSALGPLPSIRVGSQPYAFLPIMLTDGGNFPTGSNAEKLLPTLSRLRAVWNRGAANLDWVGKAGVDPGKVLIKILQRDGIAQRLAFRPLLGPQIGAGVSVGITGRSATMLNAQRQAAARIIDGLGARNSATSPLLKTMHFAMAPTLTDPVVQAEDSVSGSGQRAAEYLEIIASLRPDRLLQHDYDGGVRPRALLFSVARLAMLELADGRAREVLTAQGNSAAHWDDEDLQASALSTPLRRLQAPDPSDPIETVAFHLSEQGRDAQILNSIRQSLRWLKARPPGLLDLQLRACLGLFSNRLDAWYTALATQQLLEVRNGVNTSEGINVGAYGVLENISRSPRQPVPGSPGLFTNPTNGGYIHAPSVNQGAAAAVLRSVHLAHSAANRGEAFSVDLSSERVRRALTLLEGIRAGQPIAALLGERIERELTGEQLQRFIAPLRGVAPLLANVLTPSLLPAESVAATNVVDGLTLLAEAGYDGKQSATVASLWLSRPTLGTMPTGNDLAALQRVLNSAQDTVDALSDLVLAESVYQAVQGNPVGAGAAVDSTSGAAVPPAQMNVMRTPRAGIAATHRLIVLLGGPASAGGWGLSPRAAAEPRLESWSASVLPPPDQIYLRALFRGDGGTVVDTLDDLKLTDLLQAAHDSAADHLLLGALDVIALADPADVAQRTAFEVRISALIELKRPAAAGNAALELVYDRQGEWDATKFGIVETLEIAAQLRNLIGHARPLAPADLGMPGQAPALATDDAEYARRAQGAVESLTNVIAALTALFGSTDAAALRAALFAAEALGVAGSAPTSLRDAVAAVDQASVVAQLQLQVTTALSELARRNQIVSDAAAEDSSTKIKAVFGDSFVSLPVFGNGTAVTSPFATAPAGAKGATARTWLARASRVREGVRLLDTVIGCAEAVAQTQQPPMPPQLNVGQLGGAAREAWIALPPAAGSSIPGGRVSVVAMTAGALPTEEVAGLFIDEWIEVVPSSAETTSVAFHYEAPLSAPPQTILLAVPHPGLLRWTPDIARQIVAEALSLSRIRLVDMDDIPSLGQLLPSFVTAENSATEIVGLDVEVLTRTGGR
jgi:hypothetical protein